MLQQLQLVWHVLVVNTRANVSPQLQTLRNHNDLWAADSHCASIRVLSAVN